MKNLLLSIVVILLSILSLSAQYGEISGRVTDLSGEGVPHVSVLYRDMQGIIRGTAVADWDGYYSMKPVSPGSYTLKFESLGMNTHESKNVVVVANQTINIEIVLLEIPDPIDEVKIIQYQIPVNRVEYPNFPKGLYWYP
jgi:hypothetical protein